MRDSDSEILRVEVNELGRLFGDVIERFAGKESFELVERVRHLTRDAQNGDSSASGQLYELLAQLDEDQLKHLIRSFTLFLELANLAEDRQRIRVLRSREQQVFPQPRPESIRQAIASLSCSGVDRRAIQALIDRVSIELVVTAHPTEAKRRSVRRLLREIQATLSQRDVEPRSSESWRRVSLYLVSCLEILWHTDLIRSRRPTVAQEVERGLAILPNLWQQVPAICRDLREALAEYCPAIVTNPQPIVRFGSWIGGDRDGNPFVTPQVTRQTFVLLRRTTIEAHLAVCRQLMEMISVSERQALKYAPLSSAISEATDRHPEVAARLELTPEPERLRKWLKIVEWRLEQTALISLSGDSTPDLSQGAYLRADSLLADVQLLASTLRAAGCGNAMESKALPWIDQIRVFGLHGARLDIRQHSSVYRAAIDEIWLRSGCHKDPTAIDEEQRIDLLNQTRGGSIAEHPWSPNVTETLELFAVLRRAARRFGMAAIGEHVVSMTSRASDVLAVLWLWKWSESVDGGSAEDGKLMLPIVPLFETIEDLEHSTSILRNILGDHAYRAHVRAQDDYQTVMIGYSDSTKDGGYLTAQWSLYRAQKDLCKLAQEFGVTVDFFHGRGGSLGRGGGPAARSILSLPADAFSGTIRLTEQGEVLAERYDNEAIAYRHLEQIVSSTLIAASPRSPEFDHQWRLALDEMASQSFNAYRQLVEHPSFGAFFRSATPIELIERLPIGSRPAKRKAGDRIEDLRAIPWVFSWTQNRCLLPAWYGLGTAYKTMVERNADAKSLLAAAYVKWPFLQSTVDNASLALAKANMTVFRRYCLLADHVAEVEQLVELVLNEYQLACQAAVEISGCQDLLGNVPWLRRSIQVRNGYVDPLNLMQVELIQRRRRAATFGEPVGESSLDYLLSLSVKGVAAGMRTTG